jgi:hypothetical protein
MLSSSPGKRTFLPPKVRRAVAGVDGWGVAVAA